MMADGRNKCEICKLDIDLEEDATYESVIQCDFCDTLFHIAHIINWLYEKFSCPKCRKTFPQRSTDYNSKIETKTSRIKCEDEFHFKLYKMDRTQCYRCQTNIRRTPEIRKIREPKKISQLIETYFVERKNAKLKSNQLISLDEFTGIISRSDNETANSHEDHQDESSELELTKEQTRLRAIILVMIVIGPFLLFLMFNYTLDLIIPVGFNSLFLSGIKVRVEEKYSANDHDGETLIEYWRVNTIKGHKIARFCVTDRWETFGPTVLIPNQVNEMRSIKSGSVVWVRGSFETYKSSCGGTFKSIEEFHSSEKLPIFTVTDIRDAGVWNYQLFIIIIYSLIILKTQTGIINRVDKYVVEKI